MKKYSILRVTVVALILVTCVNRALALEEDPDSEHHHNEDEAHLHDHEDHGEHNLPQVAGEDEDTIANAVPSSNEHDEEHDNHDHNHHEEHDDHDEHDHHHQITPAIKQFGEDCSSNTNDEKCDEDKGLSCSEGKCACSQDPAHLEYSEDEDKCVEKVKEEAKELTETVTEISMLPKAVEFNVNLEDESEEEEKDEANESAEHVTKCSEECSEKMGILSKCDEEIGKCICHDTERDSRPIVEVSGKCWLHRKINDNCSSHDECSKTIKGKAWCHMDFEKVERYCQCEAFYYFDETLEECLPLATDGVFSPCKTDKQCTGFGVDGQGLGPRALCSSETNKCICQLGLDGTKGFLQDNYCYSKLSLGDYCHKDRECQLNLPALDVVCSAETKTCSCRNKDENGDCPLKVMLEVTEDVAFGGRSLGEGQEEEEMRDGTVDSMKSAMGGLNGSNFIYAMIIGGVVVCAVVIALVVVLRRRHRYSVVRTRDTTADIADASQP